MRASGKLNWPPYVSWNPAAAGTYISLSRGDLQATALPTGPPGCVLANQHTIIVPATAVYWENVINSTPNNVGMGIGNVMTNLNNPFGTSNNLFGFLSSSSGQYYIMGNTSSSASLTVNVGDVFGFVFSYTRSQALAIFQNGTYLVTVVPETTTWYPCFGGATGIGSSVIANFTAASWIYGVPAGYTAIPIPAP